MGCMFARGVSKEKFRDDSSLCLFLRARRLDSGAHKPARDLSVAPHRDTLGAPRGRQHARWRVVLADPARERMNRPTSPSRARAGEGTILHPHPQLKESRLLKHLARRLGAQAPRPASSRGWPSARAPPRSVWLERRLCGSVPALPWVFAWCLRMGLRLTFGVVLRCSGGLRVVSFVGFRWRAAWVRGVCPP